MTDVVHATSWNKLLQMYQFPGFAMVTTKEKIKIDVVIHFLKKPRSTLNPWLYSNICNISVFSILFCKIPNTGALVILYTGRQAATGC